MTSRAVVRTCIGCRSRADQQELVRVALDSSTEPPSVVWDPERRRPGRGAWLHPGEDCLLLALRRRAFGRAFRSAVDADALGRTAEAPADRPTDEGGSEI
ncbi:YlxR family protein [Micrococcus luteus]|nr:YlxR family protein [Micrococcus luteus]MCV7465604.1 YlxR family protein [Micrococcus luteus]MCV7509187.1 YlxR family protein [Micrococcus luteus]MCV7604566.1 YlxR family protein [Micrococcus luteus]MCV7622834.1 YlxR family protein [Micrococcus luteus]